MAAIRESGKEPIAPTATRRPRPHAVRPARRLASRPSRHGRPTRGLRAADLLRRHWPFIAVIGLFVLAAMIVPTMTPAAVGDDWVYARSVEILLREGRLQVLDLSVVTLVFQIVWGALFAAVFGLSFGALRLSTVALTLVSGWALYGLCRELGIGRARSAVGVAAYLFNPLLFVLAFSFMTDPQFVALLVLSTLGYVRGLRPDRPSTASLVGGSVAAGLAFLTRQQGALIPLAVVVVLAAGGRLRLDRASLGLLARSTAAPAAAMLLYYLWLFADHGVPEQQSSFVQQIHEAGWDEAWLLIGRMIFISAMYVGLFVVPIAVAALPALPGIGRFGSRWGWAAVATWVVMLAVGIDHFAAIGFDLPPMPAMPYIPQYLGPTGLGPNDLYGGRPWLVGWEVLGVLTAVCAAAAVIFALGLVAAWSRRTRPDPTRFGGWLVLAILLWQLVGVMPPSFHFRNWIVSVDRYLLPLLPLAIALGLWAARGRRFSLGAAWTIVVPMGLFAVFGTRDFLVFQGATWDLARGALQLGVGITQLDAGASWDGYYLYEYSLANAIPPQTPDGPWWTRLFAPATDSSYIIATYPLPGYVVVSQVEYSTWLDANPVYLFLLRREDLPGPP